MGESNTGNPAGDPVLRGFEIPGRNPHDREFDRFEKLTGKLLKVPKSELDQKREKS
jgi:hypothetical protein